MKILVGLSVQLFLLLADAKGRILRVFPEGQEVEYSYLAVVTTGSHPSTQFVSQFNLTGNVLVQGQADHAVVQMLDLKYSALNGKSHNHQASTVVPLPSEAEQLLKPFYIYYNDGKVFKILVDSKEPKWSRSIKQALAGVLQLDVSNLNKNNYQSFTSKEDSIHGECSMMYSVEHQNGGFTITKFHSSMDCASEPVIWSNVEGAPCSNPESIQYDLVSSDRKIYTVSTYNDSYSLLINKLWSEGVMYTSPTPFSNQALTITVSQLFELQKAKPISRLLEVNNPQEIYSLKYDASEFYSFKFSTNEDLSRVVLKVLKLIFLFATELHSQHFQLFENYNPQHSHFIPLLITFLRKLDVSLLENTLSEIEKRNSSSAREIFVKILPLVGSRESTLFIVNLIRKKRIQDDIAIYVLSSLPFNVRQATENMMQELEVLINLPEDVSFSVRNTAILTFSTLLHRTCSFNKCANGTIIKYANQYLQHIKDYTSSYENQQLYMTGLQNIQSEQLLDILKPYIFGDKNLGNGHLRVSAMRAAFPKVVNNPDKVYDIYWQILYNRTHSLELRANALMLILKVELSLSMYLQLHWLMVDEPCQHLYNLYFTFIKSYAETENDCFSKRREIARRVLLLSYTPKISIYTSFYHKFDISTKDFIEVMTVANLESGFIESAYISCSSFNNIGNPNNYFSVYIKIKGMKKEFVKLFAKFVAEHLKDYPEIKSFPELVHPLHIEFIVYVHDKAIATRFYNETNLNQLFKEIKLILNTIRETQFSFYHVTSTFSLEKFFVTDLGMPGVLSVDFPTLSVVQSDPLEETFNIRYWSQGSTVFKVKNTIANIWQGIIKTQVGRYNLPLHFKVNTDNLQLMFSKPVSSNALFGFEWHINTDIFTVTYHEKYDALLKSCQKCESLVRVTNQRKIGEILNEQKEDFFSSMTVVSDCDDDGSVNYIKSVQDNYSNSSLSFIGVLLSGGYFLKNSLSELPITGSCSYVSFLAPEDNNHTTKFFVNVKHGYSSTLQDSYDWKNKTIKSNLVLSYGVTRQTEDQEFQLKSTSAETVVEECVEKEHLDEHQDVCFIDQCKQSSGSSKFNKLVKFSASLSQVPEHMQAVVLDVINHVKSHYNQHMSHVIKGTSPSRKVQAEFVLNCKDRTYSLDLGLTSKRFISKPIAFDIFSNIVLFLKDVLI